MITTYSYNSFLIFNLNLVLYALLQLLYQFAIIVDNYEFNYNDSYDFLENFTTSHECSNDTKKEIDLQLVKQKCNDSKNPRITKSELSSINKKLASKSCKRNAKLRDAYKKQEQSIVNLQQFVLSVIKFVQTYSRAYTYQIFLL